MAAAGHEAAQAAGPKGGGALEKRMGKLEGILGTMAKQMESFICAGGAAGSQLAGEHAAACEQPVAASQSEEAASLKVQLARHEAYLAALEDDAPNRQATVELISSLRAKYDLARPQVARLQAAEAACKKAEEAVLVANKNLEKIDQQMLTLQAKRDKAKQETEQAVAAASETQAKRQAIMREGIQPEQAQGAAVDILQRVVLDLEAASKSLGSEHLGKIMQAILALVPVCQQPGHPMGAAAAQAAQHSQQAQAGTAPTQQDVDLGGMDDDLDDDPVGGRVRSRSPLGRPAPTADATADGQAKKAGRQRAAGSTP